MSACLSAGASLTPSPVIATTSPVRLQRAHQPQLVLGRDAREHRRRRAAARSSSSSSSASSSRPVEARAPASPNRARDRARGRDVVAGDHLDLDAGLAAGARPRRARTRAADRSCAASPSSSKPPSRSESVEPRPVVGERRSATARTRMPLAASASTAAAAPSAVARSARGRPRARPSGRSDRPPGVQRGHELALGVERDRVEPRRPLRARASASSPRALGRLEQRALRRRALPPCRRCSRIGRAQQRAPRRPDSVARPRHPVLASACRSCRCR